MRGVTMMNNVIDAKICNECIEKINNAASVSLFPHVHADGDALGSVFALARAIKKTGKTVRVFLCEKPEDDLLFLVPENSLGIEINVYSNDADINNFDVSELAIGVDCATKERMDGWHEIYKKSPFKIKIDHHIPGENSDFGDLNIVNPIWSATGEAIWHLLDTMGAEIDYKMALCLYTAILTDTGRFIYSNVTSDTFEIASKLIQITGSDVTWVARRVYDVKPQRTIRFLSAAYSRIEYFEDGKIAYVYIPNSVFSETEAYVEDSNALSSIMRDIDGVKVSIFVRDAKNSCTDSCGSSYKVSMRSSAECDVAAVASVFGGGGHVRAAGLSFTGTEKELKEKLLKEVGARLGI